MRVIALIAEHVNGRWAILTDARVGPHLPIQIGTMGEACGKPSLTSKVEELSANPPSAR